MTLGEELARVEAETRAAASTTSSGVCTAVDWATGTCTVNVGGSQTMSWVGSAPWPGDTVRVTYAGQQPYCQAVYGAAQGTVQTVVGNIATVIGDDGQTYVYPQAEGFSSGHRVWLNHAARLATARYLAEPPGSSFVSLPPPPPKPAGGSQTFRPTTTGNYRFGSLAGDAVDISDTRSGFIFYGTQIADTIPDGASITRAVLQLNELYDYVGGTASRLGVHSAPNRPGSPPALTGVLNVTGGGDVDVSGGYADALKTGAAFGFGFPAGYGYRGFGTGADSGAVHIEWIN